MAKYGLARPRSPRSSQDECCRRCRRRLRGRSEPYATCPPRKSQVKALSIEQREHVVKPGIAVGEIHARAPRDHQQVRIEHLVLLRKHRVHGGNRGCIGGRADRHQPDDRLEPAEEGFAAPSSTMRPVTVTSCAQQARPAIRHQQSSAASDSRPNYSSRAFRTIPPPTYSPGQHHSCCRRS